MPCVSADPSLCLPAGGVSAARVMAASKPVEAAAVAAGGGGPGTGAGPGPGPAGLPRWQLALALGAPLVLGAGALYLWGRRRRAARGGGGKGPSERKTPEGRASPGPGGLQPDGPGHDEMVSSGRGRAGVEVPGAARQGGGVRVGQQDGGLWSSSLGSLECVFDRGCCLLRSQYFTCDRLRCYVWFVSGLTAALLRG